MKTPLGRLVLGLSLHALVSASSSNVLSLDQFNFDSSIKSNPAVIVNCMLSSSFSPFEDLVK